MGAELLADYIATVCFPLSVLMGILIIILLFKVRIKNKFIKKMETDNILQGYKNLIDNQQEFINKFLKRKN